MNVLIIGNGYIGKHLYKWLNGVAKEIVGNKTNDFNLLTKEFLSGFTHIVLVAGHSSVPSCNGPLKAPWNNNVRNFSNLLDKTTQDQHIIYASSSSVYGGSKGKVCTEEDFSLEYMNNYDLTKIALDQVALNAISKGRKVIGLRFGTVNGSSPLIRTDLLVNSMVYAAYKTDTINMSNSHISRPFLSINDLTNAIVAILHTKWNSGIYNLATANKRIGEYAHIVSEITKTKIVDHGNTQGVYDFNISSELFKRTFDFQFTDSLENVIQSLLDCYKNNAKTVLRNEYYDYKG